MGCIGQYSLWPHAFHMLCIGAGLVNVPRRFAVNGVNRASPRVAVRRAATEGFSGKKLIVGLGNPGNQYDATRHNIGFDGVDRIAEEYGISLSKSKFSSIYGTGTIGSSDVILIKPQTFMNFSGNAVRPWMDYFNIKRENCIILHDAADIPVGGIKLKLGGNSGGQNGIQNIIERLGTKEFLRLKIGIGRPQRGDVDLKTYVLGRFPSSEATTVNEMLQKATKCVITWVEHGADKAMCDFNAESMTKVKKTSKRPSDPAKGSNEDSSEPL